MLFLFWLENLYLLLICNLLIYLLEILISFICVLNLILFLSIETFFRRVIILLMLLLLIDTKRNSWDLWHFGLLICFRLSRSFLSFSTSLPVLLDCILAIYLLFHYQVHCAAWSVVHITPITHWNIFPSWRSQVLHIISSSVGTGLSSLMKPSTRTRSFILLLWHWFARIALYPSLLRVARLPYDPSPRRVLCPCSMIYVSVICLDAWVYIVCVALAQKLIAL